MMLMVIQVEQASSPVGGRPAVGRSLPIATTRVLCPFTLSLTRRGSSRARQQAATHAQTHLSSNPRLIVSQLRKALRQRTH